MHTQRTLCIIKPDATRRNLTGPINERIEAVGLRIIACKRLVAQVLSGEDAIVRYRALMGDTAPGQGRSRHDPPGLRAEHRGECGARLG